MLAGLQKQDILYNEVAAGSFFQVYSQPYAGGMFLKSLHTVALTKAMLPRTRLSVSRPKSD
ncbi:hypothetical protein LCGC14_0839430 [marine sediment metagenome]|uniref:Uncharacterized protein n=1 Tax=marine sediment metagenome TaxID=412755 RepID=A0A0F9PYT2_9ZZZZ